VVTGYDGTGEVRSIEHPDAGTSTAFTVDDLGRVITRADSEGTATRTTTFRYDTATSGIGQLHYAVSPDAIRTTYRYDDLGHRVGTDVTDETTNTTYRTDTSYDSLSRVATVTYPDLPGHWRFALTNGYNNEGYLATVSDTTATPATTLWRATARNADLALTGAALGQPPAGPAAITLVRGYDGTTGHVTGMTATRAGGTTLQSLSYGYYPDGLVETRTQADSSATRNETYTYDDLHRLTGWGLVNGAAPAVTTGYAYDSIGNLTAITGGAAGQAETRGIGRHDGTLPHALTSRQNESYGYDRQGRMISTSRTQGHETTVTEQTSYNAHDLPKTITVPGTGTWSFRYDAFGSRVSKSGPDGSTFYVLGVFEHRISPGGQHSYVHLVSGPDGPVGQYSTDGTAAGTMTFTLTDALGSTGTTTDQAGQPTGSFFYEPYGARVNADGTAAAPYTGTVHNGFTGHEHDDPLGKINMKGRIYSSTAKTFLSADPVTSNHPYMYVDGNPTNAIDPTGFDGFYTEGQIGFDPNFGVTFSYPTVNLDYLYNNGNAFYANFSASTASWSDWDGYYARTAWYDQALDWYWGRIEQVAYVLGDQAPNNIPLSEQVRGKTFSPDQAAMMFMAMADGVSGTTSAMSYWAETGAALQGMQPLESVLDDSSGASPLGGGGLERFKIAAGPYEAWGHRFAYVDDLMTGTPTLFYESTGVNSGRPGTWFPSNGIDIGAEKILKSGTYQQALEFKIAKATGNDLAIAELRALIREGGPELKPAFDWMNSQQRVFGEAIPLTAQELNTVGHGLRVPLMEPNPLPFTEPVPPPAGWGPDRFDFMKNYPR
jgi:RHS repeat-associated protein